MCYGRTCCVECGASRRALPGSDTSISPVQCLASIVQGRQPAELLSCRQLFRSAFLRWHWVVHLQLRCCRRLHLAQLRHRAPGDPGQGCARRHCALLRRHQ